MINATSRCIQTSPADNQVSYVGAVFSCLVIVLSAVVTVTIVRTPTLHNNNNFYMASISVCDLLVYGTQIVCAIIYSTVFIHDVNNTKILDTLMLGMAYSSILSSAIHLSAIAIDRYIYILKPFYYIKHMTRSVMFKLLLFIWIITVMYLITPTVFYRSDKFHVQCILQHPPTEYFIVLAVLCVTDFVISCVCYYRIARVAFERQKAKTGQRQQQHATTNVIVVGNTGKSALKSVKFFVAMFGTFILCYSPPLVMSSIYLSNHDLPNHIFMIIMYCFHVHSVFNFCIYFNMNKDFRVGLKKLFKDYFLICCKQREVFKCP